MQASKPIPDQSHVVTYHPRANLYVWKGPFEDRWMPERAGWKWNLIANAWATSSPFVAYKLAPGLPELVWLKARLALSWAESSRLYVPFPAGVVPHDYQVAGIEYMLDLKVAYLADEPGLGKTLQVIGLANLKGVKRALVICPAHLRINWSREITKFGLGDPHVILFDPRKPKPALPADGRSVWIIVSYETATKYAAALRSLGPFDLLAADEAHALKEPTSKRAKVVLGTAYLEPLTTAAKQLVFISGTPAPNRAAELWPILRATAPHLIADCKGFAEFCDRFQYFVQDDYGYSIRGSRNEDELGLRLRAGFMVRRKKEDVLPQLPPKIWKMVVWPSDAKTRRVLEKEAPFSAAEIERNGVPAGSPLAEVRREMGLAKLPLLAQYLEHLMESGIKKVLCFAHHREVVSGLHEALGRYGAVKVFGGVSDSTRQKAVDAFQNDAGCRLFFGNLQAAGTGLTLTSSHHVVLGEGSWVPGENDQAIDRCHRIGQEARGVYVHLPVVEGSLDAMILGSAARKDSNLNKILDQRRV